MNIGVIGTGYVGLVTGACLADVGNSVLCADRDTEKIDDLNRGEVPIHEEGLEPMVEANRADRRLGFTSDVEEAVRFGDIIFIAVGTPPAEDGSADISQVLSVGRQIADAAESDKIVVCKSTVPVGTTAEIRQLLERRSDGVEFEVVFNPEFLREGSAVRDFQKPYRIVVGTTSDSAARSLAELYEPFVGDGDAELLQMDPESAEMSKYASNAILATKISFMNEISGICDRVGADVESVREAMSRDERIGPHYINPGAGYGGSCFPKDLKALSRLGEDAGARTELVEAVMDVNDRQKMVLFRRAKERFDELRGKVFAVWGLSFKPGTADIRGAPSIRNIRRFLEEGVSVRASDPAAISNARTELADSRGDVEFDADPYRCLKGVDALFIFTEWDPFEQPDFKRMHELMERPLVFDGRNLYDRTEMEARGFEYRSIGRPPVEK